MSKHLAMIDGILKEFSEDEWQYYVSLLGSIEDGVEWCEEHAWWENYVCTRDAGHDGPHIAGVSPDDFVAVWE